MTARVSFVAGAVERRKQAIDRLARAFGFAAATLLIAPLVAVIGYLLVQAWPALTWSLVVENPARFMTAGGLWAPLVGTIDVVVFSLAIAAPVGVLAGIYLNEYARDGWLKRLVQLAVMNLAGIPSIVHGLFGVGAFVLAAGFGRSVLAASCTLAIMTLPVIITSTTEALASVPMAFREACWNVGASRWQTVRTMVLPNAMGGILTGIILQVSRAAGETAPILFTGAVFYVAIPDRGLAAFFPYGIRDPFMALSYHLFVISSQVTGVSDSLQYATAVLLVLLVLSVNAVSIAVRYRLRSRARW